jgi:hypothetical protein
VGSTILQLDKFVLSITFISVLFDPGVLTLWFINRKEAGSVGLKREIAKDSYDRVITANDCHHLFAVVRCVVVPWF